MMTSFHRVLPPLCVLLSVNCHAPCAGPTPVTKPEPELLEGYVESGGGVRLFYRLVGMKSDTVIVLHGGPGLTMEYFAKDLTPLAAHHTLLFYDQRGSGRSSLVSDSAALDGQRFAEDLEAVRQHFGMERVTLLGHSWGAGVAALYASRYPDRIGRLLIVDGIPLRLQELVQAFEELAAHRDSATRQQMQEWMDARRANPGDATACHAYYVLWFRPFFVDPSAMSRSQGDFCAGTPESRRNKIASVDRYVAASLGSWDWRPALRRVNAPALIIHGSADPLPAEGGREWAAALPDARFLLLRGVGHFPYLEAPEAFFIAVGTFLRGSWPQGAERVTRP
jgi:proline iminopeptidase